MLSIPRSQMPTDEPALRQALGDYLSALEEHKETVGLPKPWPEFDILFAIVESGHSDFVVVDDAPAPAPITLAQLQALARKRIDAAREAHIAAGVTFKGKPFQTDPVSLKNLNDVLGALAAGIALPRGFTWRAANNLDVPFKAEDVKGLAAATMKRSWAAHQKARTLKDEIAAAQTEADVQAVKWV